ncbi:GNAT family N-acetyltransferase [Pelagibius sp. 7325]|uniref:GNAT family N-acetyltransferase n=1 Tax=Pelagibius sp. 7325 TaxID=3131994 RepID=UPI0030ED1C72
MQLAERADFESVVQLVNDAYRGISKTPGWTNESALLTGPRVDVASLHSMTEEGGTLVLVTRDEISGAVSGCVALRPPEPDASSGSSWYLSMLAVDPTVQKVGAGRAIMANAEAYVRDAGGHTIRISVIQQREALIEWYERGGYVRTGIVEPFPYDDPSVGTPLRDDLRLVELKKHLESATAASHSE